LAALHSSDPLTPYLACWARIPNFRIEDLEHALYEDKSLLRMHTIRRTLFVVLSSEANVFESGATRAIASKERARLVGWLSEVMDQGAVEMWFRTVSSSVLDALSSGVMATKELTAAIPDLAHTLTVGSGRWATEVKVASRLLYLMAMDMEVVRSRPLGTWRSSQYQWALAEDWLGGPVDFIGDAEGRSALARRYLATHGPVTMTDLRWWTGWTLTRAREALTDLDVTTVGLDGGAVGIVLTGDEGPDPGSGGGVVALLPSLDSTTMGWKERDWYLGPYGQELFDTAGNAGPTVWADGRVIGGWGQDPAGTVTFGFVEEVNPGIRSAVADEAALLTEWLGGAVVMPRFNSPFGRRLSG
jgi:hypothetical protein